MKHPLIWTAYFNDGIYINQFDNIEQTKEHLFKEVLERQDKLTLFCLFNILTKVTYAVDLINGVITISDIPKLEIDLINNKNKNRLIYFRRVVKELKINKTIEENLIKVTYFIGFQYSDGDRNFKKVMQIYEDGKVVVY